MPSSAAMRVRQALRLGGGHASPLLPVPSAGFSASSQGGKPPWPGTQSVGQRRRRAAIHGAAPPLRPPAALLHKAPFHKVRCSRCAKAPLGAPHRCAPFGFMKQALCKVASAPASCVLSSGFGQALRAAHLQVACGHVCGPAPARPRASPLRGFGPRGLPVRPPRGLPQPAPRVRGAERHSGLRPLCISLSPICGGTWSRIIGNHKNGVQAHWLHSQTERGRSLDEKKPGTSPGFLLFTISCKSKTWVDTWVNTKSLLKPA